MNPRPEEWIQKAEGDYATAKREFDVTEEPNYDAVCFHAQQCAEKYLKAVLVLKDLEVPRIHDLLAILNVLAAVNISVDTLRDGANMLSTQAVEVRYPGVSADKEDALLALGAAEAIRRAMREELGIAGETTQEDSV